MAASEEGPLCVRDVGVLAHDVPKLLHKLRILGAEERISNGTPSRRDPVSAVPTFLRTADSHSITRRTDVAESDRGRAARALHGLEPFQANSSS